MKTGSSPREKPKTNVYLICPKWVSQYFLSLFRMLVLVSEVCEKMTRDSQCDGVEEGERPSGTWFQNL